MFRDKVIINLSTFYSGFFIMALMLITISLINELLMKGFAIRYTFFG